jgi:tetratricopeptide (TPR) repeat protein
MDNSDQPNQRHFLLEEAIALLRENRHPEAVPVLGQYLRINPQSEEGWFLLSFAIGDIEKKIEAIERLLEINPENDQAQERLKDLQLSLSSTESQDSPRSRSLIWAYLALGGAIIVMVGLAIFWGSGQFRKASPTTATPQPMSHGAETPTPVLLATFTATIPSPTTTPSTTPSPTPETIITPVIIDENTASEMDRIQVQVVEIRQLTAIEPVERHIINKDQVMDILNSIYLERSSRDIVADQVRVLSALGLVEPTYDLYTKTLDQIGEGIGGFYIPWTDNLFVIGAEFTGIEKFIFAHEYTHALVDQHYALDGIGVYPECLLDADYCLAVSALIEGDATLAMAQWLENFGTEADIQDIIASQYAPLTESISKNDLALPFVIREINFRYGDGLKFVDYLYQIGKWQMVNLAYQNHPQTSEQILHPEKFQTRETAIPLETPNLQYILGPEWRFLAADTLGELGTEMVLGYGANGLSHINPLAASEAAAGWGGDQYQVYYRSTTNSTVLAVNWIWDTDMEWQREAQADEFWNAMWQHLDLRYRGDQVETESGDCWQLLNDHYSCIFRSGLEVLWISSPDLDTMDTIREQYASFCPSE